MDRFDNTSTTAATLDLVDVSKSFGDVDVLHDVSFCAPAGRVTAILGPSGQGKTTLLRLIAGFDQPDAGRILIDSQVVSDTQTVVAPEHRGIGYVPQDGALFPHLSVERNIAFGISAGKFKRSRRDQSRRIEELVALVGLEGLSDRRPGEISGGQRQRVALARALAPNPRLVLLDEPFSALDASMRHDISQEVIAILRRAGTTTVMVTHDQQEAMSIADHVVVLLDGHIGQQGSPSEIYDSPAGADVARFIGDANLLNAIAHDGVVEHVLGAESWNGPSGQATVLLRPEHMVLNPPDGTGRIGVIEGRSYFGHDGTLVVRLANGELVTLRVPTGQLADIGDSVRVGYDGTTRVLPG
jgi:iron(III) transport system ATP-binding protein